MRRLRYGHVTIFLCAALHTERIVLIRFNFVKHGGRQADRISCKWHDQNTSKPVVTPKFHRHEINVYAGFARQDRLAARPPIQWKRPAHEGSIILISLPLRLNEIRYATPPHPLQQTPQAPPGEVRPGVGLAPRSDVRMPGDAFDREARAEIGKQLRQRLVLHRLEGQGVAAFEFDTDRKVVAALPATPG